ncbi:MAG: hypothetical protein NWP98_10250 [Erythrobacter sp.]|nr:hypothetical protein [Erythrobacter sp.]
MSLRIFSALGLMLALTACGAESSPPPAGATVDCAIGVGAQLAAVCTLEQVAGTQDIVIHHPDGGFRRLIRDAATGALAPLDGAEPLVASAPDGEMLQFAVGEDRYAVPVAMLAPPPPPQ